MKPLLRLISVLAAVLVWIFVAVWIVRVVPSLFERYLLDRASFWEPPWQSWLLAAALLLGCATAWRIARPRLLDAEPDVQRSALSVWPGWPLAIVGAVAVTAALVWLTGAARPWLVVAVGVLDEYILGAIALTLAAAAAAAGGHGKSAAAFLAAPMTLLLFVGALAEISIVQLTVAGLVPAVALAAGFAVLAAVTGREPFVWLAAGFASVVLVAQLLAAGLFNPTEVLGVIAVLAVPIGLLVHTLVAGAFPWRALTTGAAEILAASAALVLAALFSRAALLAFGVPAPLPALPAGGVELIAGVAMLAASLALTPVLALSLLTIPLFGMLGQPDARLGTLLVLAGIAAMVLRSIDWQELPETGASLGLSRTAGLVAVAMLLGAIGLTLALWPAIYSLLQAIR